MHMFLIECEWDGQEEGADWIDSNDSLFAVKLDGSIRRNCEIIADFLATFQLCFDDSNNMRFYVLMRK